MDTALPSSVKLAGYAAVPFLYFVAAAVAVGLTRFGGGVACVWIAGAVLLAALSAAPVRSWWPLTLACLIAGALASGRWGLGWGVAPMMTTINVAEPVLAAALLHGLNVRRAGLDSLRSFAIFVIVAGVGAPVLSGLPGAALVSDVTGTPFTQNFVRWVCAHGLGAMTFAPVFALIASGELGRSVRSARWTEAVEAVLLLGLVAMVSVLVFSQNRLPILFLPVLPLMIVAFRLGRVGAAFAIVLITVVGGWLTMRGMGPVALLRSGLPEHIQFLQFYMSVTVMTVLPVTADLTRRSRLFDQLRDSEARFRLLTERSADIVMNLDIDGTIRYVSPSIMRLGGFDPDLLLGQSSIDLVAPSDRETVRATHLRALRSPGETFSVEFRATDDRWFETHTQAVVDADGIVSGVVSAVRETSQRKRTETELALAAHTDPLTGLANRRAFDDALAALLADDAGGHRGCVALFDLDHFKRVNDTHGHPVGDEMLKAFAAAAAAHVRGGDMLARIGGEEFGLIFPRIPLQTAAAVCERIRIAVAAIEVRAGGWPVGITVSIGVAPIPSGVAADQLLRRADRALYEAKALGRNRFALAA